MAAPLREYTGKLTSVASSFGEDDRKVVYGTGQFGASDTSIELDVPLQSVDCFVASPKVASQTTAGEYSIGSDCVITDGAITVCRQGSTDGAIDFNYTAIGSPARTAS